MKTSHILALAAAMIVAGTSLPQAARAHELGDIQRTDLLRSDLSAAGREAIQVLVTFAPGVVAARHAHPGEELVYVVDGALEYQLDGQAPVIVKAGESLFIPAGVGHAVKNVGGTKAAELATYIVEKGKPLITLAR
jgi:quercetin dioxygenase-like cupin family protein